MHFSSDPSECCQYLGFLSSPCCLFSKGFLVDFFDFDLDSMAFFASLLQIVWQHEGCEGCNSATQLQGVLLKDFRQNLYISYISFQIFSVSWYPFFPLLSLLDRFPCRFFRLYSMVFFALLLQIVWQHDGCEGCNCATRLYFISADSDIDFL